MSCWADEGLVSILAQGQQPVVAFMIRVAQLQVVLGRLERPVDTVIVGGNTSKPDTWYVFVVPKI